MEAWDKQITIFDPKKIYNYFQPYFFLQFLVIKTLGPDPDPDSLKILDPDSLEMLDPDPDSVNPDPQHCFFWLAGLFPRNLTVRPRSYTPDSKYLNGVTLAAIVVVADLTFQLSGSGYSGIRFRIQLQNSVV
jgi:hypothetical protein